MSDCCKNCNRHSWTWYFVVSYHHLWWMFGWSLICRNIQPKPTLFTFTCCYHLVQTVGFTGCPYALHMGTQHPVYLHAVACMNYREYEYMRLYFAINVSLKLTNTLWPHFSLDAYPCSLGRSNSTSDCTLPSQSRDTGRFIHFSLPRTSRTIHHYFCFQKC